MKIYSTKIIAIKFYLDGINLGIIKLFLSDFFIFRLFLLFFFICFNFLAKKNII